MKKIVIIFVALLLLAFVSYAQNKEEVNYVENSFILKIDPQYAENCLDNYIEIEEINQLFQFIQLDKVSKNFPHHQTPQEKLNKWGFPLVDISTIYTVSFNKEIPIKTILQLFSDSKYVEYAEPNYIEELLYTPNDPLNTSQYHLTNIQAYAAWDIWKGDSSVVVGIVDTGTDLDHPDLEDALAYNYNDTIDGIDNDNDGFIDNYQGWDLGEADNDPQVGAIVHGSHVSGISSAVGDNTVGIIGTGFNCKYIPIKIDNATGSLTHGYPGIVYAADHGCDVINCSWGSMNSYSQYGDDIVNYATNNCNALVVAACGNANNEIEYYPASYKMVMSVAATNSADEKWTSPTNGSTYNYKVDIAAPGYNVFSTINGGGYVNSSGTSMASPLVVGCAALVKSYYASQNLYAWQLAEILKVTADVIDTIPYNTVYEDKLGTGRVNLFRAISDTIGPSIKMLDIQITDNNDGFFESGDTLSITAEFINYLDTTQALEIIMETASSFVELIDSSVSVGVLNTMSTYTNTTNTFKFKILATMPFSYDINLNFKYIDSAKNYFNEEFYITTLNVDYVTIDTNKIRTTITSKGIIGYNDMPYNIQGKGFIYGNYLPMLSYGGLLIGNSTSAVSDNLYGMLGNYENDFRSITNVKEIEPPLYGDKMYQNVFCDSNAVLYQLNLNVTQNTYAWDQTEKENYIVLEYVIKNYGATDLNNLYVGFFADWDILNYDMNYGELYQSYQLAYVRNQFSQYYAGIQLLSDTVFNHYAVDNDGSDGSININDGFSSFDKYTILTTSRVQAGVLQNGNDVSNVVSTGPYDIVSGDSIRVVFALHASSNLVELQTSAQTAYNDYNGISSINNIEQASYKIYPQPSVDYFIVEFGKTIFLSNKVEVLIENTESKTVFKQEKIIKNNKIRISTTPFESGVYYICIRGDRKEIRDKIIVVH